MALPLTMGEPDNLDLDNWIPTSVHKTSGNKWQLSFPIIMRLVPYGEDVILLILYFFTHSVGISYLYLVSCCLHLETKHSSSLIPLFVFILVLVSSSFPFLIFWFGYHFPFILSWQPAQALTQNTLLQVVFVVLLSAFLMRLGFLF